MRDAVDRVLSVGVDQAIEGPAELDLFILRRLAARPEDLVTIGDQFGVPGDDVFEDVGDVPDDPEPHLDLRTQPVEMIGEGVLIEPEDAVNRLGPVGDQAEGHGQDGTVGHQAAHHLVMGGEPAPLGPDLLVGEVADDRRDPVVAQARRLHRHRPR